MLYNKNNILCIGYMDNPSNVKSLMIVEKMNPKTTKKINYEKWNYRKGFDCFTGKNEKTFVGEQSFWANDC